jgi:hypothetical protein
MRIQDIEKLFQNEETLEQVLVECKDDFEKVDYVADLMKRNITDNPQEAKKALNELTGVFMTLNTVSAVAETEKKNREVKYYNKLRIDTENLGKKFVSSVGDKEASGAVANYRRIRNYVVAYRNDCEKAISTLQSILKQIQKEMGMSGKEE